MSTIRESVPLLCAKYTPTESRRSDEDSQRSAYEVCDTIIQTVKDRFTFTKHLTAATLLLSERFHDYGTHFPTDALKATVEAYPMLNKPRLKTELSLIYDSQDLGKCKSTMALFNFILDNNLLDVLSETSKLLRILITIPMTTTESERCFSTLKRIKEFLRNTMSQERLNALAILSIENRLIREIPDFNGKVIEKFASLKNRRAKFLYK
ncbi:hypothetical protein UPYG_G00058730 [Umbra pygmaea]|uniref:HAT C-terminal dimerisation domain-containing protein n=1 Tax=Umbra pygmaea TaxID=75934 RepID=A0ABD0X8U0_UMBPY